MVNVGQCWLMLVNGSGNHQVIEDAIYWLVDGDSGCERMIYFWLIMVSIWKGLTVVNNC